MLNTILDLLLRYTLFMAVTAAPNLSSAAVMTTGISSPVLITSGLCLASKSGSKGRSAPGAVSKGSQNMYFNKTHLENSDYCWNSGSSLVLPGPSCLRNSLRFKRFRCSMIRKATRSRTRITTFTEKRKKWNITKYCNLNSAADTGSTHKTFSRRIMGIHLTGYIHRKLLHQT